MYYLMVFFTPKSLMFSTWVDGAYKVHHDMRGYTRGTMSFGVGVIYTKSFKKKLYTKSSVEVDSVGVSNYLFYHKWLVNFLDKQDYNVRQKLSYQDNQSTIEIHTAIQKVCCQTSSQNHCKEEFLRIPRE